MMAGAFLRGQGHPPVGPRAPEEVVVSQEEVMSEAGASEPAACLQSRGLL